MTGIRANRIAINSTGTGIYTATFYRTHKVIAQVTSTDTKWKADSTANSTAQRESYRAWVIEHSTEYGVEWLPELQAQAWERKYNRYMTDEQIGEDAITLVQARLEELADKGKYKLTITDITLTSITARDSTLTYVENGRYTKDNAWCMADIELNIVADIQGNEIKIPFQMEMKSGQICKPKMVIMDWNERIGKEMELNGIEYKEVKTA